MGITTVVIVASCLYQGNNEALEWLTDRGEKALTAGGSAACDLREFYDRMETIAVRLVQLWGVGMGGGTSGKFPRKILRGERIFSFSSRRGTIWYGEVAEMTSVLWHVFFFF